MEKFSFIEAFGNKVRVRVCGIIIQNNLVLAVKHNFPNNTNLWAPPGGGIQFGECLKEGLLRELKEETNLDGIVGDFIAVQEFIEPPLHSIELFFEINSISGNLVSGSDPEIKDQIIQEVKFLSIGELKSLPPSEVHPVFKRINEVGELLLPKHCFKN